MTHDAYPNTVTSPRESESFNLSAHNLSESDSNRWQQKVTLLTQENELLSGELDKMIDIQRQNSQLSQNLKRKENECDTLSDLIKALNAANTALQTRTHKSKAAPPSNDSESDLLKLRSENERLNQVIEELKDVQNDLEEKLTRQKIELSEKDRRIENQRSRLLFLQDNVAKEEDGYEAFEEKYGRRIAALSAELKEKQREITEYREELSRLRQREKEYKEKRCHSNTAKSASREANGRATNKSISLPTKDRLPKHFGHDHVFLGPSLQDPSNLITQTTRTLSSDNRPMFVSFPIVASGHDTSPESKLPRRLKRTLSYSKQHTPSIPKYHPSTSKMPLKTDIACEFCKILPIVGNRYLCSTCGTINLCENCYGLGCHGFEDADPLFDRVQQAVFMRCPDLAKEDLDSFLNMLRMDICHGNFRKYNFCLNWVADLYNGKTSRHLQARALEIPHVSSKVRNEFVSNLRELIQRRRSDLELKAEWEVELDELETGNGKKSVRFEDESRASVMETVRVWIIDEFRANSPFLEKRILKKSGVSVPMMGRKQCESDGDSEESDEEIEEEKESMGNARDSVDEVEDSVEEENSVDEESSVEEENSLEEVESSVEEEENSVEEEQDSEEEEETKKPIKAKATSKKAFKGKLANKFRGLAWKRTKS